VQYLPTLSLEIVDRNRYGLMCLLVHTERKVHTQPKRKLSPVLSSRNFTKAHLRCREEGATLVEVIESGRLMRRN
jgi:hypothetical protein